ncbi:MAG: DUF86 domain-containing protein [Deltaproteobacteria bacterium]|nr:DUF86 domain-containing protein [Deltaproteobacteria bacterium]
MLPEDLIGLKIQAISNDPKNRYMIVAPDIQRLLTLHQDKMVKAVGFRNFIVHEYGRVELKQVFEVAKKEIEDLEKYLLSIFSKLGI